MSDIPTLIGTIEKDRALAIEVLRKLPQIIESDGMVQFNLDTPIKVPSVQMLQKELTDGNIGAKVASLEALSRGLVQELDRVATLTNSDKAKTYWRSLDLKDGTDNDLSDPLYRAQTENGLRMPYEGFTVNEIDRKHENEAAKVGDWLLPNYTLEVDKRHNGNLKNRSTINVAQYPIANGYQVKHRVYQRRHYYYGHYYRWWRYRSFGRGYTVSTVTPRTTNLDGSLTAQTFKVDSAKVLVGINLYCYQPGSNKTNAQPHVLLTGTSYGHPDINQVLARGDFRDTQNYRSTGRAHYLTNVDFDRPVLLEPGKSYAFVIIAKAHFPVTIGGTDRTGGVFYTQDGEAWLQNINQDMFYELCFANFSTDTATIEIGAIELSGGIASMRQDIVADLPSGAEIRIEMKVNNYWTSIDEMDNITSLPPYTPMRLVLSGTASAMPLLDTTKSTVTGFRPATQLRYFSQPRSPAKVLRVTYELMGYNEQWHIFDPGVNIAGTRYTPSLIEYQDNDDGNVRSISAVYELPSSNYRHDIIASTKTAAKVFDVSSVIEINV